MRIKKVILLFIKDIKNYMNPNKIHCDNSKLYSQRIKRIN